MNQPSTIQTRAPASLLCAIAETMTNMSVQVEALGADLCADPAIVQGHLTSLQTIDRLAQHLDQIALVLDADDPVEAIDKVALSELKEHLLKGAG